MIQMLVKKSLMQEKLLIRKSEKKMKDERLERRDK